jgi:hypothetical protein
VCRFKISLRIMRSELDPDFITELVGVQPDEAHRRGDVHKTRSGVICSPFSEGLWVKESPLDGGSLEEMVVSLLSLFQERTTVFQELQRMGFRLDIFIGAFMESETAGFSLSSVLLKQLANLGVTLDFDLYFTSL